MRVRCIMDGFRVRGYKLTPGKTYQVIRTYTGDFARCPVYTVICDGGYPDSYFADSFTVLSDNLPAGWQYCKCDTITSNKDGICCGCKQ
jgi:hypothetical protein